MTQRRTANTSVNNDFFCHFQPTQPMDETAQKAPYFGFL
jgi:hypothetical protein